MNNYFLCYRRWQRPKFLAHEANMSIPSLKVEKVCRTCRRNRRGAAAVEFAIVAPVFFLLVFGMVEYGRMVMVQQVITNAAREGARVGVLDGSQLSDVQTAVNNYLIASKIPTGLSNEITCTPNPPSSQTTGNPVTVTVSIPFSKVSWLPTPLYLGSTTLSATSVMRREGVQ
ncbi:MAG TPA: TadE/TadG family type IV pilus assembly protein [Pirellulales bacterium]|nr:TadE/TadG family type IV pilus assembly protein [Pirellulales bacterium]